MSWYLPDRLGTIRDLLNNSGSIIDHVDYSAFGTQLDESTPSNGDRLMGFAGLVRDTNAGLNLGVKRIENPGTARWASQDPLSFAGGDRNLYRYIGNQPYNGTDRFGEADEERPKGGHGKGARPSTKHDHEIGEALRRQDQFGDKPNHERYRQYKQPKVRTTKPTGQRVHINKYKPQGGSGPLMYFDVCVQLDLNDPYLQEYYQWIADQFWSDWNGLEWPGGNNVNEPAPPPEDPPRPPARMEGTGFGRKYW